MIKSCSECKTPCCRSGPGPYTIKPAYEYLRTVYLPEGYNTACEEFQDGKCKLWGSPMMPVRCELFVCQVREYSDEELERIQKLLDGIL